MMDSGCILHSAQTGYRISEDSDQLAWDDMQSKYMKQKSKRNTIALTSTYSNSTASTTELSIDSLQSRQSIVFTEDKSSVSPSSQIDVISCSFNNDFEANNEVRKQKRYAQNHRNSSPSTFNQNANQPERPEKTYNSTSRLARLPHFSFRKKAPVRQKIPFHMRYQEWTEKNTQKEIAKRGANQESPFENDVRYQSNNINTDHLESSQRRRMGTMFDAESFHPSASSPVCSTTAALSELAVRDPGEVQETTHKMQSDDFYMCGQLDLDEQTALNSKDLPSPGLNVPGYVPRRKSTGTFEISSKSKLSTGDNGERLELLDEQGAVVARYVRYIALFISSLHILTMLCILETWQCDWKRPIWNCLQVYFFLA